MPTILRHMLVLFAISSASLTPAQDLEATDGKSFTLIPIPNSSRWIHTTIDGRDFLTKLSDDRIFRTLKPEQVTITKVDASKDQITLVLESDHLGKGKIFFENTTDWPAPAAYALANLILDGDGFVPNPAFVASMSSKTVHFSGSNHLPAAADSQAFSTVEEALSQDFKRCSLCFKRFPRYSGFDIEQQVATFQAASIRGWGPPHMDYKAQERVQLVGDRVLKNWPIPLKGYRYRFVVLDSDIANAAAVADVQNLYHNGASRCHGGRGGLGGDTRSRDSPRGNEAHLEKGSRCS